MALDMSPMSVSEALRLAKNHYSEEGYNHALRVMQNVADNNVIKLEYRDDCLALAIMHDLWEDTDFSRNIYLPENFKKALVLLTKDENEDYIDYIKKIREGTKLSWGLCAYYVKLADIKDHFQQEETLTDRLKNKYVNALRYLL